MPSVNLQPLLSLHLPYPSFSSPVPSPVLYPLLSPPLSFTSLTSPVLSPLLFSFHGHHLANCEVVDPD